MIGTPEIIEFFFFFFAGNFRSGKALQTYNV